MVFLNVRGSKTPHIIFNRHVMKSAIIRKQTFISMVVSCIEVYKKEALGLLLGRIENGNYVITDAVSYQSAKRDYEYVSIDVKRQKRVDNALRFLTKSRVVGDFHSHPDYIGKLSKHDKQELLEAEDGFVSITLVVKKTKTLKLWKRNADESTSGTIGNNFFVKITAFHVNNKGRIVPVRIKCDSFKDINKRMRDYRKLRKRLTEIEKQRRKKGKIKQLAEKRLRGYTG